MSIFFLNSTARVYNDKELNAVPKVLFSSGVFNTTQATRALWKLAGDFYVEPAGGTMSVTAKPGMASIEVQSEGVAQQAIIQEDNELSANVASNVSLANRNDAVVLRIDQSVITDDELNEAGSNAVSLVVVSGNSANALTDNEIAVALSNDPFVRLADLLVPLNATEITADMLTDRRSMATMTRAVSMGSDSFRFYALADDPETLEQGMIWYNSTEDILKFYNGVNTIALQSQDFDWGYYPPNGVDQNIEEFDPIVDVPITSGVGTLGVYKVLDVGDTPGSFTLMAGELFEMPNIENPYIRLKLGNPTYAAGIAIDIWAVDGSDAPTSNIETVYSASSGSVPKNDHVSFYLDGLLYTPGTKYLLVVRSNQIGFVNSGNDADFITGQVQYASYEDEDGYLLGRRQGSVSGSLTDNASSLSWGSPATDSHLVMSIAEREEYAFGETDATGNAHEVAQGFIPKSQDITGFRVIKGADIGSPTGDITASLYNADENYLPTGDVITSAVITEADWAGDSGTEKIFDIAYDELVIGSKYVILFETDDHDDENTYTLFFGGTQSGKASIRNTADGWSELNGDFFHAILTSSIKKIVVTDFTGKIDADLIPSIPKRVTYIESEANPAYSTDTADAVCITALDVNIASMTTNKVGTPSDFQELVFRITDAGTGRTIAWGADFEAKGVALPTSVTAGKTRTVKFIYDAVSAKWGCVLSLETA